MVVSVHLRDPPAAPTSPQGLGEDHSDPSSFLAESIHEMFDEYYSVSLSFWTRAGLAEKARQGYVVGSLPWGYMRDPDNGDVVPDPVRANAQGPARGDRA